MIFGLIQKYPKPPNLIWYDFSLQESMTRKHALGTFLITIERVTNVETMTALNKQFSSDNFLLTAKSYKNS